MPEPAVIAITPGEPAGIGPDLCVLLAQQKRDDCLVIIADEQLLQQRARALGLPLQLRPWQGREQAAKGMYHIATQTAQSVVPGKLNPANASYVLHTLKRAADGCLGGEFDAMVTGPVHKGVINDAGIPFSGHTEFLAQHSHSAQAVMMLVADTLRVALVTTHLPLAQVSRHITADHLRGVIEILHRDLRQKFHIDNPRILVCGLNPHAGEGGHLGYEEQEVIEPVIQQLRARGMRLNGPLPADTLFTPATLGQADAVLAMYHDQGLPVLKHVGFGHAVNITLGLPFIRTSVDHGTALELAASGNIDGGSLQHAITLAHSCIASQ